MVFFLIQNIAADRVNLRATMRKGAISTLPVQLESTQFFLIHKIVGGILDFFNQVGNGFGDFLADENMNDPAYRQWPTACGRAHPRHP